MRRNDEEEPPTTVRREEKSHVGEIHEDGEIADDDIDADQSIKGDDIVSVADKEEDDGEEDFSDSVENMTLTLNSSGPASPSEPLEYTASM